LSCCCGEPAEKWLITSEGIRGEILISK